MDSAVEMPAAISRDIEATGTTTSDLCLAGGPGRLAYPEQRADPAVGAVDPVEHQHQSRG